MNGLGAAARKSNEGSEKVLIIKKIRQHKIAGNDWLFLPLQTPGTTFNLKTLLYK